VVPARKAPRLLTYQIDLTARIIALLAFAGTVVVAFTHWAVRQRHLSPFGPWPRLVRKVSDPLLRPVERRLLAVGGNPQDGPLWLSGAVVVAGLFLITGVRWLLGSAQLLAGMRGATPASWVLLLVSGATSLMMAAIFARVIGSWLGLGRGSPWMKPAYRLTDWLIQPIRRRLPAYGPIDFSPFVAYLGLLLVRSLLPAVIP
jgi:YggT family protein